MKKSIIIISFMLVIILNSNNVYATIKDIDNHWAYAQIIRGVNNEWINGYEDNLFKPDNNIKKNEFIKMLVLINNNNIETNESNWDKPYIKYAYDISLLENADFDANQLINRLDVFKLIYKYINILVENNNLNLEYKDKEELSKYIDLNTNDNELIFLINSNILTGYPDNTLKLNEYITRAEAICIINKTIDFIDSKNYSYKYNNDMFSNKNIYRYTNYDNNNDLFLNTYRIENKKVKYTDNGRLGIYINKSIEKYNKYIIDILLSLFNKDLYVLNTYNPNLQCIYISLGESKEYLDNGNSLFEVILYENEKNIRGFNYNVQINIYKLWKEINDIKQNNKINEKYLIKFINLLKVFLSNQQVDNIIKNIQNNISSSQYIDYYFEKINNNYYIYLNL